MALVQLFDFSSFLINRHMQENRAIWLGQWIIEAHMGFDNTNFDKTLSNTIPESRRDRKKQITDSLAGAPSTT